MLFKPISHVGFEMPAIREESNHTTWLKTNPVVSFWHLLLWYTAAKELHRQCTDQPHRRGYARFNKNHVLQANSMYASQGVYSARCCWDVYSHIYKFSLTWTNCSCFNIVSGYCFSPFYLLTLNLWLPAQTLNCFEGEVNQNSFALFWGAVLEQKFRLKLFLKIRLLRSDLKSMDCNDFSV